MNKTYRVTKVTDPGWDEDPHGNVWSSIELESESGSILILTKADNRPKPGDELFGYIEQREKSRRFRKVKQDEPGSEAGGTEAGQDVQRTTGGRGARGPNFPKVELDDIERLYRWAHKLAIEVIGISSDEPGEQIAARQASIATLIIAAQKVGAYPERPKYDIWTAYFDTHELIQGEDARKAFQALKKHHAQKLLTDDEHHSLVGRLDKASGVSEPAKPEEDDVPF